MNNFSFVTRGKAILDVIRQAEEPLPYMHIFALLNLLKQICNHPALVSGNIEDFEQYQSGKWELFKELISETLDSGQKAVVFSQYLEMLDLIEEHLGDLGVEYSGLRGATRKRSAAIRTFQQNDACRVFVASLLAGGLS